MKLTMNTRTAHTSRTRLAAITAALAGTSLLLAGCAATLNGTYLGTAEDTALIINKDGTCSYTERYKPDDAESLQKDNMDDCTWTKSKDTYTFSGLTSSGGVVTGTLQDDGSLSLPDQDHWNGEIYTKKK